MLGVAEYPEPASVTVMLVTCPFAICAIADAPEPVLSVMVTAGAAV